MDPKVEKLLLEIHTDDGFVGWGEAKPGGAGLFAAGLGELLIGEDPVMIERIWQKVFSITHTREGTRRRCITCRWPRTMSRTCTDIFCAPSRTV